MKLRDAFWIWGHKKDSLVGEYALTEPSKLSPADALSWMGVDKLWYVPMFLPWDREECCREAEEAGARRIGFSLEKPKEFPEHVEELVRLSEKHPKMTDAILDDFFNPENAQGITPDDLLSIRNSLHSGPNPVTLWMVYYTKQYGYDDIAKSIGMVDGLTMWFWNEPDERSLREHCAHFLELSPGKRRMCGLYLYDFGGSRPADPDLVLMQLEQYRKMLREGSIEGVILHTNVVMDQGFAAPEAARKWLAEHGDEEL